MFVPFLIRIGSNNFPLVPFQLVATTDWALAMAIGRVSPSVQYSDERMLHRPMREWLLGSSAVAEIRNHCILLSVVGGTGIPASYRSCRVQRYLSRLAGPMAFLKAFEAEGVGRCDRMVG